MGRAAAGSRMRSIAHWVMLAATVLAGCTSVREHDAGTDAQVDAHQGDAGPPDARPSDCPYTGEHRRCDGICGPADCPRGTGCVAGLGLCMPADASACSRTERRASWCSTGDACAMESGAGSGTCANAELCEALREAGSSSACVWSDGSARASGPPASTCPSAAHARAPPCGGSCSGVRCPSVPTADGTTVIDPSGGSQQCVGVSDARGFGTCVYSETLCREPEAGDEEIFARWLELCGQAYGGAPCGCLVLEPQTSPQWGFFVEAATCAAYARAHPGLATCRDASWSPVP